MFTFRRLRDGAGNMSTNLRRSDWDALARLAGSAEPQLSLSWAGNGVASRLIAAGYVERTRPETGLPYLIATWAGQQAVIRWIRKEITPGAHEALVLFRGGHKMRLAPKVHKQLSDYGLISRAGISAVTRITPLGTLVATAPPGL